MLVHAKTGLQFRFGAEPSLTMVRREHGFIFSEWASGWELVCWMMSALSLNALGMPEVYFGDGQGYAHGHTLEFLREGVLSERRRDGKGKKEMRKITEERWGRPQGWCIGCLCSAVVKYQVNSEGKLPLHRGAQGPRRGERGEPAPSMLGAVAGGPLGNPITLQGRMGCKGWCSSNGR